jgi:hypothetical protein
MDLHACYEMMGVEERTCGKSGAGCPSLLSQRFMKIDGNGLIFFYFPALYTESNISTLL